jgi:hypothetical protein
MEYEFLLQNLDSKPAFSYMALQLPFADADDI